MTQPTSREIDIGRFARSVFGGETAVRRFGDDDGKASLFLASGMDCPIAGVTSYATVGLSNCAMEYDGREVRVELVGACASTIPGFSNVIASCAIERIKNGTPITYGSSIAGILDQYNLSDSMRHLTFVAPFLWDGFVAGAFEDITVHWLQAIPISDGELQLLKSEGVDRLERLFEQAQIDVFDINRATVA